MSTLITSDLHLSSAYHARHRWGIFEWLRQQVEALKDAGTVLLLGDITDAKDRHDDALVNRLVSELVALGEACEVVWLPGNHDGLDISRPFFRFLNCFKSEPCRGVKLIGEPTLMKYYPGDEDVSYFLPSTRDYKRDWAGLKFDGVDYIFTHQTFDGAEAENGQKLPGIPPAVFADVDAKVYSGDVHTPQRVGRNIEYVGSPYRVRFGDSFTPRVLLLDKFGKQRDLHFPCPSREVVLVSGMDDLRQYRKLPEDTQVKIRVKLRRSEYSEWPKLRRELVAAAAERGWEVCGVELLASQEQAVDGVVSDGARLGRVVSPTDVLDAYGKRHKLSRELRAAGLTYLNSATGGA
jgi:DNA repair exonuclease SbcCD nuclease subunit